MSDLIERKKAIDVLSVGKELLSRVLDDIDVVGTDRKKYSWGLGLIESNIKDIEELPPAEPELNWDEWCTDCKEYDHEKHCCPRWNRVIRQAMKDAQLEIVRCKDCKYAINIGTPDMMCKNSKAWVVATDNNFGCVFAERRTDGV